MAQFPHSSASDTFANVNVNFVKSVCDCSPGGIIGVAGGGVQWVQLHPPGR